MKKIFLLVVALATLVPACAKIQSTPPKKVNRIPSQLEYCMFLSDKATQYTVYASVMSEHQFIKTVADNATAASSNNVVQNQLLKIGAIAWKYKMEDPAVVGLAIFNTCVEHNATSKQTNKFVPPPGPKYLT